MSNDAMLKAKANEAAKRAVSNLPEEALYAIGIVAPHVHKGAFWGFTDMKDIQKHYEALKSAKNTRAIKISNAVIVEVAPNYLISAVKAVDPNLFTNADLKRLESNMAEAMVEFRKWLVNNNINNPGQKTTVGIYSVNDVTTISYKGKNFPAFRLNAESALNILGQLGYKVEVNGNMVSTGQAVSNLVQCMQLSPTKTGVFIQVQPTMSVEQAKEVRKQIRGNKK